MPNSPTFRTFYWDHYLWEHRHPVNIALHIVGVVAGLGLLAASATAIPGWWALAFPIVHVAPGLIGHWLFERNEAVGDARLMRTDFPLWWFVVANHLMALRLLNGQQ